jgi:hypothetical protein
LPAKYAARVESTSWLPAGPYFLARSLTVWKVCTQLGEVSVMLPASSTSWQPFARARCSKVCWVNESQVQSRGDPGGGLHFAAAFMSLSRGELGRFQTSPCDRAAAAPNRHWHRKLLLLVS